MEQNFERIRTYDRILSVAFTQAPTLGDHDDLRILELVLNLAFIRTLAHARIRVLDGSSAKTRERARALSRGFAFDVEDALRLAHVLSVDLSFEPKRAVNVEDSDPALVVGFLEVIDNEFLRGRGRARELARTLDISVGLTLDRDISLDVESAQNLARDLDLDLSLVLDLARDLALALDRDHDRDRKLAGIHSVASDLARSYARDHPRDYGRDLALDLALALTPDAARIWTALLSFRTLLLHRSSLRKRSNLVEGLTDIDVLYTPSLRSALHTLTSVTEDPRVPLQHARDLLSGRSRHYMIDAELWEQARLLIGQVHNLVAPILDRTARYDRLTLSCARMGLLAAAVLLHELREQDTAVQLLEAHGSLAALQSRAEGQLNPNELLLLVRT